MERARSPLVVDQFIASGTSVDANLDGSVRGEEFAAYVTDVTRAFPDLRLEQRRLIRAESDGLLVEEWTMHDGTLRGPLDGLPSTGKTLELEGMSVVIVDEGINSIRGYFDQQRFAEQLRLTFPAVLDQLPTLATGTVRRVLFWNHH